MERSKATQIKCCSPVFTRDLHEVVKSIHFFTGSGCLLCHLLDKKMPLEWCDQFMTPRDALFSVSMEEWLIRLLVCSQLSLILFCDNKSWGNGAQQIIHVRWGCLPSNCGCARLCAGIFFFFFYMSQGDICGLTQHGCNVGVAGLKKTENCCLN